MSSGPYSFSEIFVANLFDKDVQGGPVDMQAALLDFLGAATGLEGSALTTTLAPNSLLGKVGIGAASSALQTSFGFDSAEQEAMSSGSAFSAGESFISQVAGIGAGAIVVALVPEEAAVAATVAPVAATYIATKFALSVYDWYNGTQGGNQIPTVAQGLIANLVAAGNGPVDVGQAISDAITSGNSDVLNQISMLTGNSSTAAANAVNAAANALNQYVSQNAGALATDLGQISQAASSQSGTSDPYAPNGTDVVLVSGRLNGTVALTTDQDGNIEGSLVGTQVALPITSNQPNELSVVTTQAGAWGDGDNWSGGVLTEALPSFTTTLQPSAPIDGLDASSINPEFSDTAYNTLADGGPTARTESVPGMVTYELSGTYQYTDSDGDIQEGDFDNASSPVSVGVSVPVIYDANIASSIYLGGIGVTVNNLTITTAGELNVDAGSLTVKGVLVNDASLEVAGYLTVSSLVINSGNLKLDGGSFGGTVENDGSIIAEPGYTSTLSGSVTGGSVTANRGGILYLAARVTGAAIQAVGGIVDVDAQPGTTLAAVVGGSLNVTQGGTIELGHGTLDGVTLAGDGTGGYQGSNEGRINDAYDGLLQDVTVNAGITFAADDDDVTELGGTITNSGTLAAIYTPVEGEGEATYQVDGQVTLIGGGIVDLGGAAVTGTSGALLTNAHNTIEGTLYGSTISADLLNQAGGTVEDTTSGSSLTISSGVTNQGLLQAVGGGMLTTSGAVDNTGGIIDATGSGSILQIAGTTSGGTIQTTGGGLIQVDSGGLITGSGVLDGLVTNYGVIEASGGTLTFNGVASGVLKVDANATLDLADGQSIGSVAFGPDSTLDIESSASASSLTLMDFNSGDQIDLKNLLFTGLLTRGTYSSDSGQLQVSNGLETTTLSFGAENTTVDDPFHFTSDGQGGTLVTNGAEPPCYCPGTLILTDSGEQLVETLAIGDTVITASGERRAIKWIGWRGYDGRFIKDNHLMLPVTIRGGAFADGVPHTDLHVSPGHAMWVDGQLVPAWRLVNGVSVIQAEKVEQVTYAHVELHQHDLLLANGAPAESFLDETGFRGQFQNAAEFTALYPDAGPLVPMQARLEDGFALQSIQERLLDRSGLLPSLEPAGTLRGYVDQGGPERVCGWAQDAGSPEEPVALTISVGDLPVLTVLANGFRADLRKAGMGSGCHAFDAQLPAGFVGVVSVRRVTDGALLAQTDAADPGLLVA